MLPRVPELGFFSSVVGDAFALAVVGYAISISLGKTFALKHGYKVDSNQVQYLSLKTDMGQPTHVTHIERTWSRRYALKNIWAVCGGERLSLSLGRSWWCWGSVTPSVASSSATPSLPPCLAVLCRRARGGRHRWFFTKHKYTLEFKSLGPVRFIYLFIKDLLK